ncbi:MAG TPA: hypothetical protein DIC42_06835 [Holosporales bacterium]|nr:hypothetical protein [Holosporales bacterium]
MDKTYLDIKDLDGLIIVLQNYRQQYGNIPVHIDLSVGQSEGTYDIDAVLYSTNENDERSIDLIIW